jgi:hypothetical protein
VLPDGSTYATDDRRKHLLWLAVALMALLALALVLLVCYGVDIGQLTNSDRTEPLMLIGLLALLTLSVAYLLMGEREHRIQNRALIQRLHESAQALDARSSGLNRLSETSMHPAGFPRCGSASPSWWWMRWSRRCTRMRPPSC